MNWAQITFKTIINQDVRIGYLKSTVSFYIN